MSLRERRDFSVGKKHRLRVIIDRETYARHFLGEKNPPGERDCGERMCGGGGSGDTVEKKKRGSEAIEKRCIKQRN